MIGGCQKLDFTPRWSKPYRIQICECCGMPTHRNQKLKATVLEVSIHEDG